jgi:hypothetical protein
MRSSCELYSVDSDTSRQGLGEQNEGLNRSTFITQSMKLAFRSIAQTIPDSREECVPAVSEVLCCEAREAVRRRDFELSKPLLFALQVPGDRKPRLTEAIAI